MGVIVILAQNSPNFPFRHLVKNSFLIVKSLLEGKDEKNFLKTDF